MAQVKFSVPCLATYNSELEIPNEIIKKGKAAVTRYIQEHISECSVKDLEFLSDLEPDEYEVKLL